MKFLYYVTWCVAFHASYLDSTRTIKSDKEYNCNNEMYFHDKQSAELYLEKVRNDSANLAENNYFYSDIKLDSLNYDTANKYKIIIK